MTAQRCKCCGQYIDENLAMLDVISAADKLLVEAGQDENMDGVVEAAMWLKVTVSNYKKVASNNKTEGEGGYVLH